MFEKKNSVKTERLEIRLTSTEKEKIFENAGKANMTVSEYIVTLNNLTPIYVFDKETVLSLIYEVNRIGNNINQITKVVNAQKYSTTEQLEQLNRYMQGVDRKMDELKIVFIPKKNIILSNNDKFSIIDEKLEYIVQVLKTEKYGGS